MSNLKYTNRPSETSNQDVLAQIALDLSSSWNHGAGALWEQLNPELWELTHNPWVVLQTVSGERLGKTISNPAFQKELNELADARRAESNSPRWFQQVYAKSQLSAV